MFQTNALVCPKGEVPEAPKHGRYGRLQPGEARFEVAHATYSYKDEGSRTSELAKFLPSARSELGPAASF